MTQPQAQDDHAERVGVVLMSYGTPTGPDDIESYYTDIRRGRPPTPEALADLTRRYVAIGGVSPLAEITEDQRARLASELDAIEPGRYEVRLGFKHADPKVEATAQDFVDDGFRRLVGLVLAPHYSSASVGGYVAQLRAGAEAGAGHGQTPGQLDVRTIESWAAEPTYIDFLAEDLRTRVATMVAELDGDRHVRVLFTAHALPQRVIDAGDPYADELRTTAEAVVDAAGFGRHDWQIAWQSAGRTPEPWLAPDIVDVIDQLGSDDDIGGVIVCACGFVADHLEVLYDLDIEAAGRASAIGLAFDRSASVADDAAVISALAHRVHDLAST
jgi:ferrochelatase